MSQPRVPAGVTGGGRFATKECPRVYAMLDAAAPEPEPVRLSRLHGGAAVVSYEDAGGAFTAVPAPRCPHGYFARWAAAHCRRCQR